ncbi:MAG: thioredoxin fold domain-containing protein [Pseudomonadota bacterium]
MNDTPPTPPTARFGIRRPLIWSAAVGVLMATSLALAPLHAARSPVPAPPSATAKPAGPVKPVSPVARPDLMLLVFEAQGCRYCPRVRSHDVPTFRAAVDLPEIAVRYVDASDLDHTALALRAPLRLVPTVILMQHGREIGRISGYVGPRRFLSRLRVLLEATGPLPE